MLIVTETCLCVCVCEIFIVMREGILLCHCIILLPGVHQIVDSDLNEVGTDVRCLRPCPKKVTG